MKPTTLHIQNMCCQRCIDVVTDELQKLDLKNINVKLGEISFEDIHVPKQSAIEEALNKRGFIVLKDTEEIWVEYVKTFVIDLVKHLSEMDRKDFSLSALLEEKAKIPYRQLLEIFKKHKGYTIEKYFILQKIERVKDLLENPNIQLSEIADSMGYKSLQHLSAQFKNVSGVTMQQYKKLKVKKRYFIDML